MNTADLIQAIREDVKKGLRDELLAELLPEINRKLYDNIFDLKEAAKYRKVSPSTLRRMIAAREIPFFMQRGQYFFRQRDLDKQVSELIEQTS